MPPVWVLDEDDVLELLAFLVTAARTQVDEAREYGPLRLLTAARSVAERAQVRVSAETADFLRQSVLAMPMLPVPRDDPAGYVARLDALCAATAEHLRTHFADPGGSEDVP